MKDRSKKHVKPKSISPSRFDPSRTGGLRRALTQELNRRFAILKGRIVKLVVDEDSFGLAPFSHDPFGLVPALNAFCATGAGGGKDNSCGSHTQSDVSKRLDAVKHHLLYGVAAGDKARDHYDRHAFFKVSDLAKLIGTADSERIRSYVHQDERPSGAVAKALDRAVEVSEPLPYDTESYRGMKLTKKQLAMFKEGASVAFGQPASFASSMQVADGFSRKDRSEQTGASERVILRALLPRGTRVARLNLSFGVGDERITHSNSVFHVTKVTKTKSRTVVEGILTSSEPTLNAFCPTGKGGGRDPSCSRDVKGALRALKAAPTVKMKATDAGAPREGVLQRGNLMKVPGKVDHSAETHLAKQAVMNHPEVTQKTVEIPISSITPIQAVVSKDTVKHFINSGERSELSYEQPVVVKLPDGRHLLHDGTHRYTADKLSGAKTMKVRLWEAPVTTNAFCPTGVGGGVDPTCGKEKSQPRIEVEISDGQRELVHQKFAELGLPGTPEETMPRLVAALPGSTVTIKKLESGNGLVVRVDHKSYYCERHFVNDGDGKKHVYNSEFGIVEPETNTGKGIGSDIFAGQVRACSEAGFSHIETMAVGRYGGPTNGYYTWPRLGYDMSLDKFGYSKKSVEVEAEARKKFHGAESILDIMKTQEGRQWWKHNGLTMTKAIFDLTPGSRSMKVLSTYLEERSKRSSSPTTRNSLSMPLGKDLESDGMPAANAAWRFNPDDQKIRAFQQWMRQQLLQTLTGKTEEEMWRIYTEQGLKKGMGRAYDDVNKSRKDQAADQKQLDFYQGSQEDFLRSSFNRPVSVEKVQLLASRSFDEMQGMTSDMITAMSRTLTDGLVQKKGPLDIARDLVKKLDISKQRAELIARTEIVRAHAEGQLLAFEAMGVEELGVAVEWSTTTDRDGNFDERVCSLCRPLEGAVFSIEESRGMIPRHPRCRCAWLPANVGEKTAGQMRTQAKIVKAVKASRKREGKKSTWKPSKPISKTRPRSQVRNAFCPTGAGGGVDPTCKPSMPHSLPFVEYKHSERKLTTDSSARQEFLKALQVQYPHGLPLYHEAPLQHAESIRKNGLTSGDSAEDTNFATVGRPSDFVSVDKVIVRFVVPKHKYAQIVPDMRYDPSNPAAELLKEHSGVFGADVAYQGAVPKSWIASMVEMKAVTNAFCPTGPGGGIDPTCHPPVSTEVYRKLSPEDRSRITKVERERTALRKRIKEGGGTEEQIKKEAELSAEYKMLSDKARTGSASTQTKDVDSQPKLSHSSGITLADLKEKLKKGLSPGVATILLESSMHAAENSSGAVRRHGMTDAETMVGFDLHIGSGKSVRVSYPTRLRHAAASTLLNLVEGDIHPTLLAATHTITISTQKNQYDSHWEQVYGMKGLVSAATGGDGHMVVYNGGSVSTGTIAHECGHNLAFKLWGSTRPPDWSEYGKVQKQEPPVSEYGSKSQDEDFAEMAKKYTVEATVRYARPKKYAEFEKILKAGAN